MTRGEVPVRVIKKIEVALDAVTIRLGLESPELVKKFKFKAGQFIGVTHKIKDEEVHRSYSISSDPKDSTFLDISIKKVPGGAMSTFLVDQIKTGDVLHITPPAGHFYKENENPKHHVMFAAGSGVTPMMSILFHLLDKKEESISLFYWNQSPKGAMFLEELKALSENNPKFNLFLSYTRLTEPATDDVFLTDRVSMDNLKLCFYSWSTSLQMPIFYLCGPETFMNTIESFLAQKGYDGSQIRKENFHIGDLRKLHHNEETGEHESSSNEILVGEGEAQSERGGSCSAILDGEKIETEVEKDETILEAFLRAGEDPPYSCMDGTCMACQCKVLEGVVEMPKDSFLSEDEIEDKNILSCQAFVRSANVKVDYDDF